MPRWLLVQMMAACFTAGEETRGQQLQPSRPDFHSAPEVPAMPSALMKLLRTPVTRAAFPVVDFHFHGRELRTANDYQKTTDEVRRKVYYANALRYLPTARTSIDRQLAARR